MKELIPFLILISSLSAMAGINTVGKGGGFAEMLALKMDSELSRQLSSCLQQPNLCEISAEGRSLAEELLIALPALQKVSIRFASECRSEILATSTVVEIPSCLLYTESPQKTVVALPLKDISVLVLAARGTQAGMIAQSLTQNLKPVFEDFKLIEATSIIPFGEERVVLHSTLFEKNWYAKERSLILEVPAESQDLTELLTVQLCDNQKLEDFEARFDRRQIMDNQRVLFQGEIFWTCRWGQHKRYKAKISVTALMNSDLALVKDSAQVLIRQKENTW